MKSHCVPVAHLCVVPVFQDSLHALMATLSASNPFFVRCIKPNMDKVRHGNSPEFKQRKRKKTFKLTEALLAFLVKGEQSQSCLLLFVAASHSRRCEVGEGSA